MNFVKNKNFLLLCIGISFFLHLISVYYSVGFYSDDEHFQILEPTAYLLGINEILIDDPTGYYWEWESHARIRPWTQPYIYFKLISLLKVIGINDPFSWTFTIRLISSILGFSSIIFLFKTIEKDFFKKNIKFNYLLFFTFWFYPFLHSRTSSENLGITLFIFIFCFLYKHIENKNFSSNNLLISLIGFLIGIAMVIRFNLVFTFVPLFTWLFFFKFNFLKLFLISINIFLALCLGLVIDYFNYGSFKNTYYQFYKHNLGVYDALNSFGIEPWWFFFTDTISQLAPILSVIFVISVIFYWIKKPLNILTWVTFFTIIMISSFGHKETRYIFPVYIFAPVFIAFFFEKFNFKYIADILKIFIIFSNIIFLTLTLFVPPNTKVGVYEFIFKNIQKNEEVFFFKNNPYLINNMEPFFYTKFLPQIKKYNNKIVKNNYWVITNEIEGYKKFNNFCEIKFSTYPNLIFNLNENWKRLKLNWYIFICK